jgi:hypothetical protein
MASAAMKKDAVKKPPAGGFFRPAAAFSKDPNFRYESVEQIS